MLDYSVVSHVRVHNNVTGETTGFRGVAAVRKMFTGLFADLSDLSTLEAPVVTVEVGVKQVFRGWR